MPPAPSAAVIMAFDLDLVISSVLRVETVLSLSSHFPSPNARLAAHLTESKRPVRSVRGRGDQEGGVTFPLGRFRSRQALGGKRAWQPQAGAPEGGSGFAYEQSSIVQQGLHIGYL